jgi:hypothetical protein
MVQQQLWSEMTEPVSLEEHAGLPLPGDAVTVQAERARPDEANWQVKAYFTNPYGLGTASTPLTGVHTGFKIYRNGKMWKVIDAGPTPQRLSLGNLRFNGTDKEMHSSRPGITAEIELTAPDGIDQKTFGLRLLQAARDYDGGLPYSPPPIVSEVDPNSFGGEAIHLLLAANQMAPGKFNSNSFSAAILQRAKASSNIAHIQKYLKDNSLAAPGLEQPFAPKYFRNR